MRNIIVKVHPSKANLKKKDQLAWKIAEIASDKAKINKDAVVVICFGYPAFIRNKNGLKNMPPPIPTIPEINPIKEPIKIDKIFGICFTITWFLLNDLLSINKNIPAITKTKKSKISNNSFPIEIEAPKKAKGMDPKR